MSLGDRPVLLLFVGSGCAALIYEIVWFQTLQLVIGASAVSLAVLLGAFMGGMSAGSILLPRYISPRIHPLKVSAAIEVTIAISGAALIAGMPLVGRLYTAADGGGSSSIALRAFVSLVLLLPPATLMGATLPAIARYVKATPAGGARLGLFYGGNIAGAVIGCLLAGFYLLRWFDLATASLAAISLNVCVASAALILAARAPYRREEDVSTGHSPASPRGSWQPRAPVCGTRVERRSAPPRRHANGAGPMASCSSRAGPNTRCACIRSAGPIRSGRR